MEVITVNEFINNFDAIGSNYAFFDWFCNRGSLKNRAKPFISKLQFLIKEGLINGDTTEVFLKNNCPLNGQLYDDMRFSTIKNNEYLGGIAPSSGHYHVWFYKNGTVEHTKFNNWTELKKILKDKDNEFTIKFKNHFYK